MAVFRVERNKGYTVMSNHHLRNKELSLKAKGLLSQMLSLPEDWDYTLAGLSFINREKIDAIREAVKELERAGYIVRSRERDEKGRLRGTDYVIFEQPQTPPVSDLPTLENPTLDNPTLEKPTQEKPTLENPMQLNKDIQKTDLPKKEKSNTDLSSTDSIPIHSLNPLPYDGEAATPPERKRKEATDAYSVYEEIIKDNIEYDHFVRYGQVDKFIAFSRILPSRLAVVLLCQKEDLSIPGNLLTARISAGIPVVLGKVRCRELEFKGLFNRIASSGGYRQVIQQFDAIVGKVTLCFPLVYHILQYKCEGFRGRRYIARLLHHFRNGKFQIERVGGYHLRCPCGGGQPQCHNQSQQQGE